MCKPRSWTKKQNSQLWMGWSIYISYQLTDTSVSNILTFSAQIQTWSCFRTFPVSRQGRNKDLPQRSPTRIPHKDLPRTARRRRHTSAGQAQGRAPLIGASQTHRPGGRFTNRLEMVDLQDIQGPTGQPLDSPSIVCSKQSS